MVLGAPVELRRASLLADFGHPEIWLTAEIGLRSALARPDQAVAIYGQAHPCRPPLLRVRAVRDNVQSAFGLFFSLESTERIAGTRAIGGDHCRNQTFPILCGRTGAYVRRPNSRHHHVLR